MTLFRTESDSMGPVEVSNDALYKAQTARAVRNFPISKLRFPRPFLRGLGLIKKHAAATNTALSLLDAAVGAAIEKAAQEVVDETSTRRGEGSAIPARRVESLT